MTSCSLWYVQLHSSSSVGGGGGVGGSSSSSNRSRSRQLDAGHRPLCPIHCVKQFPITKQNQNKLINC